MVQIKYLALSLVNVDSEILHCPSRLPGYSAAVSAAQILGNVYPPNVDPAL